MSQHVNLKFIEKLDYNLNHSPKFLQVILGPRQVGKTTSVHEYLNVRFKNRHHYASADLVLNASHDWITAQWQEARRHGHILVIDEIQKCHNWAEVIKRLWDAEQRQKDPIACILLGSSSLQIQKGLTESLTGRFQLIQAFHWNFAESEIGYELTFDQFLKFGGYPGSYQFMGLNEWRSYVASSIVSTVIEKDILQFNTVKNPALFKQAFEILMAYPAMEISYTKLLGQLQSKGNVELIKYYLELYQGAFLIKVLEKYSASKLRIKSSSPKILPLAPCFYYLGILDEYTSDERGRIFEALVGAQLARTAYDLYYWREGKFEIDFVLKVGRKVWGIEVKSGRKKSALGSAAFLEAYPGSKVVIVTPENYAIFERDPMAFLEKSTQFLSNLPKLI
jgi:uncharacterized protein